ncbi:hypothetical protein POPTR_005G238800v4 [Populus trichocarpa]|uniref:Uncharacterized protein n=4 Tax=Populus trichocarpa TaxID=3694 RepID=A0A3N7F029_POPTR|nr:uncharacterized protein LOC7493963 isoform X1 [Populus trichocarpa]KAI5590056.1 hypothetical protein BDE02_05G203400 [Populus trichocarpa]RQO90997.1 hypothetical protein POPTR_005G238800v4 [Populus trichocarpa]|eukprot:XP_024456250.1 uncharacterized protein LOC7493963 isoform X1 [Populus trichocarpa]
MIEMDKSKDVRPRASRFSRQQIKQSGHKLLSGSNGGDFVVSLEKSKRIKRLSAVNNNINKGSCSYEVEKEKKCEMGGGGGCEESDKEVQAPSTFIGVVSTSNKRFKLPRKFLDDCDGVDHATVPRKLRSAMKKRNRESISPHVPDSKKLNHPNSGVESSKRDGLKKSRLNVKQPSPDWSREQSVRGPITKDEEEVVETLYSLAGMFTDNEEPKNDCKLDNTSLDASPSTLQEPTVKEDLNLISLRRIDEAAEKTLLDETPRVDYLNKPGAQERPYLPTDKIQGELGSRATQMNLPPILAKQEELKSLCNSINLFIAPEQYRNTPKVKHSTRLETSLERKPDIALGLTTTVSQLDQRHTICQSKNNGPALWPGLSSTVSSGACNHGSSSQSSATKFPSWMDTALGATRPNSFQNCSSIGKVSKVSTDKRSLKRSTTHVYISHLIRVLQIPESKDSLPLHLNQPRPQDILRQGAFMTMNDFNGNRNGLNGATSARAIINMVDKNSNQVEMGTLLQRTLQDQPQTSSASGVHNSQKQTFNFLSLSADGSGLEANNSSSGVGKRSEQSAQLQFPYLHSHLQQQHSTLVPFPMSQTYYSSSSHPDQPAAAQQAQIQQPSYLGHLYCGTRASPTGFTKQQQKQSQQQQQLQHQQNRLWAAQLAAAQYRTLGNSTAMTQFPNWQNGRQDSPAQISFAQTIIPTSSSQEAIGPKHAQISQQQQLMTITTLPHARVRRQDHHLSSVYEETGGGFRTGGALPLQLLCNESL